MEILTEILTGLLIFCSISAVGAIVKVLMNWAKKIGFEIEEKQIQSVVKTVVHSLSQTTV